MPTYTYQTTAGAPTTQHPAYVLNRPRWTKFVHIYDGEGGFLDGTYLVAHPREWEDWQSAMPRIPTAKLTARRALSRYENIGALILDQFRSVLFREPITRTVGGSTKKDKSKANKDSHPIEDWWENVDGQGWDITEYMAFSFVGAALFGSVFHYMDREPGSENAYTAADVDSPYLRAYTPLDVPDWTQDDRGQLTEIRLLENVERETVRQAPAPGQYRQRIVTAETWETYVSNSTETEDMGVHGFGVLPVVVQYAKRRKMGSIVGVSLLGEPSVYIDHFNIISETRELERGQTFGILAVKLGTGDTATPIEKAQAMLGTTKGAENVLFTPDGAEYIQPDASNIQVYHEEYKLLQRTMYRLAGLPYEADSKDAEAEGSLKLKREDMNQLLSDLANNCQKTEVSICKLWFRGVYGESWEAEWDKAEVVIRYPDTFDVTPFAEILEQAEASVSLEMGRSKTFALEQSKRLVPKFLPDLPPDVAQTIEDELAAAPVKSPAEQKAEEMALRFGAEGQPPKQKAAA